MFIVLLQSEIPMNLGYLAAAYFVAWGSLLGYLVFISKKRRSMEIELKQITNKD
tara:strand:- start:505 stop:666 length:162 start_codon:yes stop_codon:yes gene_type:complete